MREAVARLLSSCHRHHKFECENERRTKIASDSIPHHKHQQIPAVPLTICKSPQSGLLQFQICSRRLPSPELQTQSCFTRFTIPELQSEFWFTRFAISELQFQICFTRFASSELQSLICKLRIASLNRCPRLAIPELVSGIAIPESQPLWAAMAQAASFTAAAPVVFAQAPVAFASGSGALGPQQLSSSFLSSSGLGLNVRVSKGVAKQGQVSLVRAVDGFLSMLGLGSRGAPPAYDPAGVAIAQGPDDDTPASGCEFACFGAGCFWGLELAYQRVPGVVKTEVGYTQGQLPSPTYEAVCSGNTGHSEVVRVQYNPVEVSYESLLDVFWDRHDPTTLNRQGGDVGPQYRSGIYLYSPEQERVAKASLEKHQKSLNRKIVTEVIPAKKFYRAESYHQQYLAKGGRMGFKQSAEKGCTDNIRCYG